MPAALQQALAALQKQGVLPRTLSPTQTAALERSLARYSNQLAQDQLRKVLDEVKTGLADILNPHQVWRDGATQTVTEGLTQSALRSRITTLLQSFSAEALAGKVEFMLDVSAKVAGGAGKFIQQNADPEVVNLYPALELERFYDREVPRGFKATKDGLVAVPDDDWPTRWRAAALTSGDEDALRVFEETGRMMARKDSPIWQSLGDGAGGYDDTLGNPFPPFAFNSGFGTKAVSRAEAVDLGLIQPGADVAGADLDFTRLFAMEEAA